MDLATSFVKNLDLEPILTTLDFEDINIIDLDLTPVQNELRNDELITAGDFEGGEIFINLNIK